MANDPVLPTPRKKPSAKARASHIKHEIMRITAAVQNGSAQGLTAQSIASKLCSPSHKTSLPVLKSILETKVESGCLKKSGALYKVSASGKKTVKKLEAEMQKPKGDKKPTTFSLIKDAILTLKGRTGSSIPAIKKYISSQNAHVESHVLSKELKKNVEKGMLIKVKSSYKLSDAAKKGPAKPAKKPAAKKAPKKTTKKAVTKSDAAPIEGATEAAPKAKKTTTKKTTTKKAPVAKKTGVKKTATKKTAAPKKAKTPKKTAAKKTAPKKAATKKTPTKAKKATKSKKATPKKA